MGAGRARQAGAVIVTYLHRILIALDQLANTVIGGWPDETLSAYAHRMRTKGHKYWGWTAGAINLLFFWQTDHCLSAYRAEVLRRQYPEAYREAR
ncbi:MAG: hypothetical protein B7Z52_01930 [Burkholderiales bacterium 12-64-5]|nr:MAG: hypothetical protein B7Z52_01930 [Burkholderiales bacterium 12-64-5]